MQLHNSFSHTLYTYAMKYTCADLVKCKIIYGKVRAMSGASGNTNTNHGLHE